MKWKLYWIVTSSFFALICIFNCDIFNMIKVPQQKLIMIHALLDLLVPCALGSLLAVEHDNIAVNITD